MGDRAALLASFAAMVAASCGGRGPATGRAAPASSASAPSPVAAESATASARSAVAGEPCGELGCRLFDDAREAFAVVLATNPRVLAIGEAHAPKGAEATPSSARRFTTDLLPMLEGRASDLVVELMAPPSGCKAKSEQVRTKQKVVTEREAETNQSDYLAMGNEAKKRGIVPDLLRPSCADLDAIDRARDDTISVSLSTIARLTKQAIFDRLDRNTQRASDKLVVTYGGAMHNDVAPPPERAAWSFGPDVEKRVEGHYIELDLFVPEFIGDSESWRRMPWYEHYDRERYGAKAVLFRPAPGSYVLVFAKKR